MELVTRGSRYPHLRLMGTKVPMYQATSGQCLRYTLHKTNMEPGKEAFERGQCFVMGPLVRLLSLWSCACHPGTRFPARSLKSALRCKLHSWSMSTPRPEVEYGGKKKGQHLRFPRSAFPPPQPAHTLFWSVSLG